jgi:hypothetical protein
MGGSCGTKGEKINACRVLMLKPEREAIRKTFT